jgi:hypothetical protein
MTETMRVLKATAKPLAEQRAMTTREYMRYGVDVTRARLAHARATGEGYPVPALESELASLEATLEAMA